MEITPEIIYHHSLGSRLHLRRNSCPRICNHLLATEKEQQRKNCAVKYAVRGFKNSQGRFCQSTFLTSVFAHFTLVRCLASSSDWLIALFACCSGSLSLRSNLPLGSSRNAPFPMFTKWEKGEEGGGALCDHLK